MGYWTNYRRSSGYIQFKELQGQVFDKVYRDDVNDGVIFEREGRKYNLFHQQQCCEGVWLEDIIGDLNDLVGSPILVAEERFEEGNPPENACEGDSDQGWTFYELRTLKGSVTLRFYGGSNGYYSIDADLHQWEE